MNRREFLNGAVSAAGLAGLGGCRSLFGETSFYGPTIRDRLWMWGHHRDCAGMSVKPGGKWTGPSVEQAEGCRMMGIPNVCVVRWGDLPKYPWGDYFEQFRTMRRFTFAIGASGQTQSVEEMMRICFEEIRPKHPNLVGCFLDDFFVDKKLSRPHDQVVKIADAVHAHGLRLSVVLYSDNDGLKDEFQSRLKLCDETSFWFWKSENIPTMADQVRRCRDFIGADKSVLLGLYMWDYTLGAPVPAGRMEQQLAFARKFLADRMVDGLIFHPSYSAALDVDSVRLSKAWIRDCADDLWGT